MGFATFQVRCPRLSAPPSRRGGRAPGDLPSEEDRLPPPGCLPSSPPKRRAQAGCPRRMAHAVPGPSPVALHPSKLSPRRQPFHVTVVVAFSPSGPRTSTFQPPPPRGGGWRLEACFRLPWPQGLAPSTSPLRRTGVSASRAPDASMGFRILPRSPTRDLVAFRGGGARAPRRLHLPRGRRSCSPRSTSRVHLGEPRFGAGIRDGPGCLPTIPVRERTGVVTRPGTPAPEGAAALRFARGGAAESAGVPRPAAGPGRVGPIPCSSDLAGHPARRHGGRVAVELGPAWRQTTA
jgi:hypothetical protein